jgi:hypothetical protein
MVVFLPSRSRILVHKLTQDTYPGSVSSPELTLPIKFRSSGIQACDHSECFLWSYDLHRLYNDPARPPRIYMNPSVQVAYDDSWFRWHHTILRWPVIRIWVGACSAADHVHVSSS